MAVKRKNYRKKGKRNTAWYNKKYSPMEVAGAAWKGVKYLKSIVNVERKFFDVTGGFSVSDGSGVLTPLSLVPVGDAYNTRDGNSIKVMSSYITLRVFQSAAQSTCIVRYMILQDTSYNGTALTTAQILENVTGGGVSLLSPLNHTIGERVKVLCDKYIYMTQGGSQSDIVENYQTLDHHIKFDDANITTTTLREGHLYLLAISDVSTNQPSLTYYNRIRFVDN